jgi:polysaccharide pyruvyl transferase CsaB
MGSAVYKLVLSGYYGFNNSGDEAVLKSILAALAEAGKTEGAVIEPVVLSADPVQTGKMYGVQSVHRMRPAEVRRAIRDSDGLISGGGSLLQDATGWKSIPYYLGVAKLAQWAGKPVFIYSQGIGPVRRRLFYPLIRHVFQKAAYVSVRDPESAELLGEMGVDRARVEVVPDPVMGMPLPEAGGGSGGDSAEIPVVGVSVRFWKEDRSDLERLAESLRLLCRGRRLVLRFLPFHSPSDEEASRFVAERLGTELGECTITQAAAHADPQQMLLEVSRCSLLIGMRLHSLIYAASQYVPLIGISYDPKIDHFLHRLGMRAAGSTDRLDPRQLAAEADLLLGSPDRWRDDKQPLIEELKQQSVRPAQQIVRLLRQQYHTERIRKGET